MKNFLKQKKIILFYQKKIGSIKNKDKDNIWIIDPIDGTTNFLHGIPHFAICIALKSKKEIISGLIYDPIKDEMFYAEKNKGAYLNNQRLRVSNKNLIDECLFSSNHRCQIQQFKYEIQWMCSFRLGLCSFR